MTQTRTRAEYPSILFPDGAAPEVEPEPAFFSDLNLDQVVRAVTAGREEYELEPFFAAVLRDADAVEYRHEVFRDLEGPDVRQAVTAFAEAARRVRRELELVRKQHYRLERQRWHVEAAARYCEAVDALRAGLAADLGSRGLRALRDYLGEYARSERFTSLAAESRAVLDGLAAVRYTLRVKGTRVTVGRYEGEDDYGVAVEETFARFRQGDVDDHLSIPVDSGSMDHVEAQIAERVAKLYPEEFAALDRFWRRHRSFVDERVARFDREVQLYLAYLQLVERLGRAGLGFCYPEIAPESSAEGAFDLALALKLELEPERAAVVPNDFALAGAERILVVTGPNQGGKTTFARMVGQLHHLARLGLPVPAERARLVLADELYTHFERVEDIATLRGKLDDELVRIHEILDRATGDSVVILNEIFSSTTLADARFLGGEVLGRLAELGCLAVCVTFVDELASRSEAIVSMVASVAPDDPTTRTFRIVRRPADGRAYAVAIAEKYDLSYERLRRRLGP